MAKFLVQAYYKTYYTVEVEAKNKEEAEKIAYNIDLDEYEREDSNEFEIWDIELREGEEEYEDDEDDDEIYRVIFSDDEEREAAEELLDDEGCWYDYDNGDRMMLYRNGLNVLEDNSIDYDEV